MKLIQPPNSKLNNTYMFNLVASKEICNRICDGCYAIKEQVRWPNVQVARESRYAASKQSDFAQRIISELNNLRKKPAYFRVHSSGEFYSQQYINDWVTISSAFPTIIFYTYTKRLKDFDFSVLSSLPNFVLIDSLHFNKLNYGKPGTEPQNAFICPHSETVRCGIECTYCMSKTAQTSGVYFHQH